MDLKKITVLLTALDLALALASCGSLDKLRAEGYADGYGAGYDAGYDDGRAEGPDKEAYDKGYADATESLGSEAHDAGYREGYDAGYAQAAAELDPPAPVLPPELDPEGFAEVAEYAPDILLDMRYYTSFNFTGQRIEGYYSPIALLTVQAIGALKAVSDDLTAKGYRLVLLDAYRPQAAVDAIVAWTQDPEETSMKAYFYPDEDKATLIEKGYVAEQSAHSRGSTVDVTLFDMSSGTLVDMGSPYDFFGEISHADATKGLTREQIANRKLLRDAMETYGFTGISTEWWHFTLKDEPYPDMYFQFAVE